MSEKEVLKNMSVKEYKEHAKQNKKENDKYIEKVFNEMKETQNNKGKKKFVKYKKGLDNYLGINREEPMFLD